MSTKQCVNCPGAVDHTTAECPISPERAASSLPAAGSVGEEVEVVGYRFFHVDHGYIFRLTHIYEGNPSLEAHGLMTVAQHERIVASLVSERDSAKRTAAELWKANDALSAQQSAHVSVPGEWLDAVKELFDAKQAKEDFERENPGNSTKRWDACLYRIEAAEDALRALLNGGEA